MPRATASSVPTNGLSKMKSQSPSITFTGMMRTLKAMPATPTPLLVSWPTGAGDVRAVAVEIERHVVVPDEVARRDEAVGARQIGRRGERDVHRPSAGNSGPSGPTSSATAL